MLDTTTKKRIDDCRDILVGKLPDPKAQIEQITIGLIYKFMDDMDKEAINLGGKAKFFSDYIIPDPKDEDKEITVPFSNYSWDRLFDTKVTASEMLRLYSEAIEGMEKNPNIPQLFRDIFNNAYLPYRDPETLKLFLKTIGEFEYTHSEKLGDAFEYLLSVMGSQGDAGQFRTPRHIIDFLVAIVDPGKDDTIMDPACGTAGFLISAFKYLKVKNNNQFTPDEQKKIIKNFVGYDISPDMVRLSLVNLYLHGFSEPHIYEYDTLSSEERWNENFDVILANPPFMTPKGGIRPHKKFSIQANKSEILFLDYIIEHLYGSKKAGIIIPEGVLHNNYSSYKSIREKLIKEDLLYAVVELPHGVFKPYASVKTHILFIDQFIAKQKSEILFIQIKNDGFTQTGARKPIKQNDLSETKFLLESFKSHKKVFSEKVKFNLVEKTEILNDKCLSLVGRRYRAIHYANSSNYPTRKLDKKLINVFKGKSGAQSTEEGEYPFVVTAENFKTSKSYSFNCKAICVPIVSSTGHGHASVRRLHYIEGKFALANIMCGIEVLDETILLPKYLYFILSAMKEEIIASLMTGTSNVSLDKDDLYDIEIPCPGIKIQQEIIRSQLSIESEIVQMKKKIKANLKKLESEGKKVWN
ncbi:N-6 DNA methylase [Hanstruepera flava]|uniref:N-6 DNA methylase n=1 Tax=Hanstruepera flava TaxID=2930218 RepID=UPI00202917E4|nr:N-6 DNA methylase [Hanstruepera flava]